MIYASFEDCIGQMLMEVREYEGRDYSQYSWQILVFGEGILIQQFYSLHWGESRDDTYQVITWGHEDMPVEAHELIMKYTPIPVPPTVMELAQQEQDRLREAAQKTTHSLAWTSYNEDGSIKEHTYHNFAYDNTICIGTKAIHWAISE